MELKQLRELRRERGLSRALAASAAGMPLSAYRKLERGERFRPAAMDVPPLMRLRRVSLDYLLELTDERKPHA